MTRPHSDLRPGDFTVVIDTREQLPLDLTVQWEGKPFTLPSVPGTLATGDYSILGLEHMVAVERKSLGDLISCVTSSRDRFERELQRLRSYPVRLLVIEASWASIDLGQYRSQVKPQSIIGSLYSWRARYGLSFEMAGDRPRAALAVARTLYASAKVHWDDLQAFKGGLKIAGGESA